MKTILFVISIFSWALLLGLEIIYPNVGFRPLTNVTFVIGVTSLLAGLLSK